MKLLGTVIITGGAFVCASAASNNPNFEKRQDIHVLENVIESPSVAGIIAKEEETQEGLKEANEVQQVGPKEDLKGADEVLSEASQEKNQNDDDEGENAEDIGIQEKSQRESDTLGDGLMQFDRDDIFEDNEDEEEDEMNVLDDDNHEEETLEIEQVQLNLMSSEDHNENEDEVEDDDDDDDHGGRNKQQFGGYWSSPQDLEKDVPDKVVDIEKKKEDDKSKTKKAKDYSHDKNTKDKHNQADESVQSSKEQEQKYDEEKNISSMHTETIRVHEENTKSAFKEGNTMIWDVSAISSPEVLETHTIHSVPPLSTRVIKVASVGSSQHPNSASSVHTTSTVAAASDALMFNQLFNPSTLLTITGALVWFLA